MSRNKNEVKLIHDSEQSHMKNQIQHLSEQVFAIQVNPRFRNPYPVFPATKPRGGGGNRGRPWQRRAGLSPRQTFRPRSSFPSPRTFQPPRNSMPIRPANPANAICWACGKMGHFQRACPFHKQQVKAIATGSGNPANENTTQGTSALKDYGEIPSLLDVDPGLPYYHEQF